MQTRHIILERLYKYENIYTFYLGTRQITVLQFYKSLNCKELIVGVFHGKL